MNLTKTIEDLKSEKNKRDLHKAQYFKQNNKAKPKSPVDETISLQIVFKSNFTLKSKKSVGYVDFDYKFNEPKCITSSELALIADDKFKQNIRKYKWILFNSEDVPKWSAYMKHISTSKLSIDQKDGSISRDAELEKQNIIKHSRQRIKIGNNKNIQLSVGKTSMSVDKIVSNIHRAINECLSAVGSHKHNIERIYVKNTQGKAIKISYNE